MRLAKIALAALLTWPVAAQAEELTGTLQKIKETGTIVLGTRDASIPFSFLDDKQQPIGFAIDVCMKVVEAVKTRLNMPALKVSLNPVTSASRIPLLANGTVDIECGSTTNNAERKRQVAFSNTYFLTASRYVFKKASGINTIDDMKGKTVVSTSGSTNIKQLTEVNAARKLGINIIAAKDHAEGFLMVETDRAVAFVMDDVLLASFIASSKDPSLYVIGTEAFSKPEPYALMLRRDDTPFKTLVDQTTAKLYGSPDGIALYNKWFTQPIPPRGLNLNLPLSPELAKSFKAPTDDSDPAHYGT